MVQSMVNSNSSAAITTAVTTAQRYRPHECRLWRRECGEVSPCGERPPERAAGGGPDAAPDRPPGRPPERAVDRCDDWCDDRPEGAVRRGLRRVLTAVNLTAPP
ncbi:hypothetical protein GCM10027061_29930 [Nesterenkonia suensis]